VRHGCSLGRGVREASPGLHPGVVFDNLVSIHVRAKELDRQQHPIVAARRKACIAGIEGGGEVC